MTDPKTRDEIEHLKANWLGDPCWPIECTEGFEDHYQELHSFRLAMELKWMAERTNRHQERAAKLNCSTELVAYLEHLEATIARLETQIQER